MKDKTWIHILYSWGDREVPIEVPRDKDAWEYAKSLAIDEAENAFFEHEDEGPIGIEFFREENKIILHYQNNEGCCYYFITNSHEFKEQI